MLELSKMHLLSIVRPWYVETATPIAKDLVLVIDSSGSMKGDSMMIAREAAKTVVETLNPNDRVRLLLKTS